MILGRHMSFLGPQPMSNKNVGAVGKEHSNHERERETLDLDLYKQYDIIFAKICIQ